MTFLLLLGMLLFLGFCAVILVMGISDIFGARETQKPDDVTNTQTGNGAGDGRA